MQTSETKERSFILAQIVRGGATKKFMRRIRFFSWLVA
jgi:hypothetical protein